MEPGTRRRATSRASSHKFLLRWLNSLDAGTWVTKQNMCEVLSSGLYLLNVVKKIKPGLKVIGISQKPNSEILKIKNMEILMEIIWKQSVLCSQVATAAEYVKSNSNELWFSLLGVIFESFVVRYIKLHEAKMYEWYDLVNELFGRNVDMKANVKDYEINTTTMYLALLATKLTFPYLAPNVKTSIDNIVNVQLDDSNLITSIDTMFGLGENDTGGIADWGIPVYYTGYEWILECEKKELSNGILFQLFLVYQECRLIGLTKQILKDVINDGLPEHKNNIDEKNNESESSNLSESDKENNKKKKKQISTDMSDVDVSYSRETKSYEKKSDDNSLDNLSNLNNKSDNDQDNDNDNDINSIIGRYSRVKNTESIYKDDQQVDKSGSNHEKNIAVKDRSIIQANIDGVMDELGTNYDNYSFSVKKGQQSGRIANFPSPQFKAHSSMIKKGGPVGNDFNLDSFQSPSSYIEINLSQGSMDESSQNMISFYEQIKQSYLNKNINKSTENDNYSTFHAQDDNNDNNNLQQVKVEDLKNSKNNYENQNSIKTESDDIVMEVVYDNNSLEKKSDEAGLSGGENLLKRSGNTSNIYAEESVQMEIEDSGNNSDNLRKSKSLGTTGNDLIDMYKVKYNIESDDIVNGGRNIYCPTDKKNDLQFENLAFSHHSYIKESPKSMKMTGSVLESNYRNTVMGSPNAEMRSSALRDKREHSRGSEEENIYITNENSKSDAINAFNNKSSKSVNFMENNFPSKSQFRNSKKSNSKYEKTKTNSNYKVDDDNDNDNENLDVSVSQSTDSSVKCIFNLGSLDKYKVEDSDDDVDVYPSSDDNDEEGYSVNSQFDTSKHLAASRSRSKHNKLSLRDEDNDFDSKKFSTTKSMAKSIMSPSTLLEEKNKPENLYRLNTRESQLYETLKTIGFTSPIPEFLLNSYAKHHCSPSLLQGLVRGVPFALLRTRPHITLVLLSGVRSSSLAFYSEEKHLAHSPSSPGLITPGQIPLSYTREVPSEIQTSGGGGGEGEGEGLERVYKLLLVIPLGEIDNVVLFNDTLAIVSRRSHFKGWSGKEVTLSGISKQIKMLAKIIKAAVAVLKD